MKRGVVLLFVLMFLFVALIMISVLFKEYNKINNVSFEYSIGEDRILLFELKNYLSKIKIKTNKDLDDFLIYSRFISFSSNNKLNLDIKVNSLNKYLNINNLIINNTLNEDLLNLLDFICEKYNLKDKKYFLELLLDTLDNDSNERGYKTEIKKYMPFVDGRFYNFTQFKKIEDFYFLNTGDKAIYKIPWEKIISFKGYLDCNHPSKALLEILDMPIFSKCIDFKNKFSKKTLYNLGIIPFNKKLPYFVKISLIYNALNKKSNLTVVYDLINKKVEHIEKNILY